MVAVLYLSIFYVVVSLLTPAPDPKNIEGLTWEKPLQFLTYGKITGLDDPRLISAGLFLLMVILYAIIQ